MANEKRLIDAYALIEDIEKRYCEPCKAEGKDYCEVACRACWVDDMILEIDPAPTVDAVEVVHGRWIYNECVSSYDGAISGYSCSKCNAFVNEEVFDNDEFHKDFCGNCGAKMDGGNEDG